MGRGARLQPSLDAGVLQGGLGRSGAELDGPAPAHAGGHRQGQDGQQRQRRGLREGFRQVAGTLQEVRPRARSETLPSRLHAAASTSVGADVLRPVALVFLAWSSGASGWPVHPLLQTSITGSCAGSEVPTQKLRASTPNFRFATLGIGSVLSAVFLVSISRGR